MNNISKLLSLMILLLFLTGCWNYVEVEKYAIISGLAVDKEDDNFLLTCEIIDMKGVENAETSTKLVSIDGKTVFEAARKMTKVVGKKLYFGHAQILIISKDIAEAGIIPVIDWVVRDAETRLTLSIFLSLEDSAKSILEKEAIVNDILSFEIEEALKTSKYLYFSPFKEIWNVLDELSNDSAATIIPNIIIKEIEGKKTPVVEGCSLYKSDKLVGIIKGDDTKILLMILDKMKAGLITNKDYESNLAVDVTLEVLDSKTKIKPRIESDKITIEIKIKTEVVIAEIMGSYNYLDEKGQNEVKTEIEKMINNQTRDFIQKVQQQYETDVFGFGTAIKIAYPVLWKQMEPEWDDLFKSINVEVNSTIEIKSSALLLKPIKKGK